MHKKQISIEKQTKFFYNLTRKKDYNKHVVESIRTSLGKYEHWHILCTESNVTIKQLDRVKIKLTLNKHKTYMFTYVYFYIDKFYYMW